MELPAFTQAVKMANQARVAANGGRTGSAPSFPMLATNVGQLRQFVTDVDGYNHPDGPPAQPPPVPTCANGTAVSSPAMNRGLVHDCEALLAAKDTLRGTGSLDWSAETAITSWEGVTTTAIPSRVTPTTVDRVTELKLSDEDLMGSIQAELGTLFELAVLDLSSNALTGDLPAELGWLSNLTEVRLSGNQLTGCIPVGLQDVATNDLSSLNLLYCAPPAPEGLSAGTPGDTSVALSWTAVSNTSKYRVEYRSWDGDWLSDDTITGTSHTMDELACGRDSFFRASAYGSGTLYAAEWSEPSAVVSATTTACVSPVFEASSYAFSIADDAEDVALGTVSATDPNGDTVTYAITAGNDDGMFAIGASTGTLTVVGELDYEATASYTLTVEARDGDGNADAATVIVSVVSVR